MALPLLEVWPVLGQDVVVYVQLLVLHVGAPGYPDTNPPPRES